MKKEKFFEAINFTENELLVCLFVLIFGLIVIGLILSWIYIVFKEDEDIETEELIRAWKFNQKNNKLK